jgi:antitoxin component YwqK of YwqJK toxin-antitoxin module
MKKISLLFLSIIVFVGCTKSVDESTLIEKDGIMYRSDSDKPFSGEVFGLYTSGEKVFSGVYDNGVLIDEYLFLNKDGSPKDSIDFTSQLIEKDGIFYTKDNVKPYSGKVFSLWETGKTHTKMTLKRGKPEHVKTSFFENGNIEKRETYRNGELSGLSTDFYESGQKKSEGHFQHSKKIGLWTDWYEDGNKYIEGYFIDGIGVNTWKFWDSKGELYEGQLLLLNVDNYELVGQKVDGWYLGYFDGYGGDIKHFYSKDGQVEGLVTRFSGDGGWKSSIENYKYGKENGKSLGWYRSGEKRFDSNYKNGEFHGNQIHWFESGQIETEHNYLNGMFDGKQTYFSENGNPKRIMNYNNNSIEGFTIFDENGNVESSF